jgi:hypothetical protein
MLIDHYPLAGKQSSLEEVREPLDVRRARFCVLRWKSLMPGLEKPELIE